MNWRAVLLCVIMVGVTGCTATSALKTAAGLVGAGGDSGLTAQVGASNTRQGIGATVTNEDKNETTVKDSTVGTVDSSKGTAQKAQNIETGSIIADRIIVKNNDPLDQVWSFIAGGGLMLLGLGAVIWALLRHRKDRAAEKENG